MNYFLYVLEDGSVLGGDYEGNLSMFKDNILVKNGEAMHNKRIKCVEVF